MFGASVNRAAVALTGGLLLMDPDLKITVMTKENAAAQAFAVHLSLRLPSSVAQRASRLVGYMESCKGPASQTPLDVKPSQRNEEKRLLMEGVNFQQEATQRYSPR